MRKIIAAINMTVDGFCDHTAATVDNEIHEHYNELLRNADALVYGRITYQLMEDYWPGLVKHPGDDRSMNDFAVLIDNLPKLVFSHTLKKLEWETARLATGSIKEEVLALKQANNGQGKDILMGSPSMILAATHLGIVDEYQLLVHPVIAGKGLPLFKNIKEKIDLTLLKTKTFAGGAVLFYYKPKEKQ